MTHRPLAPARLLPWASPEGKPCYLLTEGSGRLSRAADTAESVQLDMAGDLLAHLDDMLDDEHVIAVQLRYLLARMNEALTDVCRIVESRGARLRVYTDVWTGAGPDGNPSPMPVRRERVAKLRGRGLRGGQMYVSGIGLSNVRGFTGARAVEHHLPLSAPRDGGGWTVIAGRNGSGKSTLLRALALSLAGPQVARSLVQDFGGWISTGEWSARTRAYVQPDPYVDRFTGRAGVPDGGPLPLGLRWTVPEDAPDLPRYGAPPQPHLASDCGGEDVTRTAARGPWAHSPQGWFCAAYGPFRRMTGGSGQAQQLMLAPGPAGRMASLFHEEASLAEGVSWLRELRHRSLEEQQDAGELLDTVMQLLSDGLLPDGYRALRVTADGLWVAPAGDRERAYPLREMSDGFRVVASLVLDIVRQVQNAYGALDAGLDDDGHPVVRMPGVVIIDEVDAHLHVTWQRRIGDWLRTHFPRIQFIVTSHSPYICQAADPGGLIRLPGPEEQGCPEVVDDALYRRVVYGSGEDAVLSELFGLETPYSNRAEEDRRRLVRLEEKVFSGEASEQEALAYRELAARLNSSRSARVQEVAARLGSGQ